MIEEELTDAASIIAGGKPDDEGVKSDDPADESEGSESLAADTEQEAAQSADSEQADEKPHEDAEPITVKALAEKLETTPAELYKALQIDVGGEQMTLGDFKDRAKQLHKANEMLADAEAHALDSSNEVLRQNRAINLALQKLGRPLSEAELKESDAQYQGYVKEQNRLAVAAIPGWKESGVQDNELKLMSKELASYGFRPNEISLLVDHRWVKYVRDNAARNERLRLAGKSVVPPKPRQKPSSKRRSAPTTKSAAERVRTGELSQSQGVLAAIADGAKAS